MNLYTPENAGTGRRVVDRCRWLEGVASGQRNLRPPWGTIAHENLLLPAQQQICAVAEIRL